MSSNPAGQQTKPTLWLVIFRLVVVPMIVIVVLYKLFSSEQWFFDSIDLLPLVAALLLTELSFLLISLRLCQLLEIFGTRLSLREALKISLSSLFYFLAVPSTIGMEAVRYLRIRELRPGAPRSIVVTSLLLDRIVGALSASLLFVTALLISPPIEFPGFTLRSELIVLVGLGAGACIGLIFWRGLRQRLSSVTVALAKAWPKFAIIVVYAVVTQCVTTIAVYTAVLAFGASPSISHVALGVMGGTVLMLIPLSFAGLGPGDVGGAALLMASGVDQRVAVLVMLASYLGRVLGGIQGAIVEIRDGHLATRRLGTKNSALGNSTEQPKS